MATLAEQGCRLLERNGEFFWVHPAEVPSYVGATDTTDMDDEEFEAYVVSLSARTA